jgi:hypothetical protein
MLMLTDGGTIILLPAWPDAWSATFKLHAPHQTEIEGRIEDGKLKDLRITPDARRKDVVVWGRQEIHSWRFDTT